MGAAKTKKAELEKLQAQSFLTSAEKDRIFILKNFFKKLDKKLKAQQIAFEETSGHWDIVELKKMRNGKE